jgi:tRNA (guanine37-N1)-methyltransferase
VFPIRVRKLFLSSKNLTTGRMHAITFENKQLEVDLNTVLPVETLDRSKFVKNITLHSILVPKKVTSQVLKLVKPWTFHHLHVPSVHLCKSDKDLRVILLDPSKFKSGSISDFPVDIQTILSNEHQITSFSPFPLSLGYEKFSVEEVLTDFFKAYKIVPVQYSTTSNQSLENIDEEAPIDGEIKQTSSSIHIPTSFELIGHIAHVNLRTEFLPFKFIIGQVILDKNSTVKTVVNKLNTISNEYRTFPMEIIAGVDSTIVDMHHCDARFKFDFRHVYWNSRLSTEHERIIKLFDRVVDGSATSTSASSISSKSTSVKPIVVADMMAGVGPFAIPIGLKSSFNIVYANDLNPDSYKYLLENISINKVTANVHAFNLDGKEFIQTLISKRIFPQHVIMNLPATAIDFLHVFHGLYFGVNADESNSKGEDVPMPIIHVYSFSKVDTLELARQDVAKRILRQFSLLADDAHDGKNETNYVSMLEQHLKSELQVHYVRLVAPGKLMTCTTFQLPASIGYDRKMKKTRLT